MFVWIKSFLSSHRDIPAAAAARQEDYWNAGLAVDPTEFSQQLVKLQVSLRHANSPGPNPVVQMASPGSAHSRQ